MNTHHQVDPRCTYILYMQKDDNMRKILNNTKNLLIPEQKNIGSFIGGLKTIFSSVTFYIGLINFVLLVPTAYNTTLKYYLPISFIGFVTIIFILLIFAMYVEYTWFMPSSIRFANDQSWKFNNPIRREFENLNKRIDKMEKK